MEEYKPKTRQNKFKPVVSYSSNQFRFNVVCSREYIKSNRFIKFYYDKENKRIAFKFTSNEDESTLTLTKSNESFIVSGKSFVDYYNLKIKGKYFLKQTGNFIYFNMWYRSGFFCWKTIYKQIAGSSWWILSHRYYYNSSWFKNRMGYSI